MSSPAPSNISQNNTKILEKQWQEIQQRHEEEQQLLAQLELTGGSGEVMLG